MKAILLIILFAFPFDRLLSFEIAGVTITAYYFGITFLLLLALFNMAIGRIKYQYSTRDLALILIFTLYLSSTLFADDFRRSALLTLVAIFIPAFSYWVTKAIIRNESDARHMIAAFGAGVAIFSIFATKQFSETYSRPMLFGQDGISMASMAILPLLVGIYAKGAKSFLNKITFLGCFACILITLSRAYLMMLLISPFLFFLFRRRKAFLLVTCLFLLTLYLTLFITLKTDVLAGNEIDYIKDHGVDRLFNPDYWKKAIFNRASEMYIISYKEFLANPLFGKGLYLPESFGSTTHNFHLEWLQYSGVVGYVLFYWLYLSHFYSISKSGWNNNLAIASSLALLVVIVNGLTNGLMHGIMPVCAFLYLGISDAVMAKEESKKKVA